jgi:hypothetical protein
VRIDDGAPYFVGCNHDSDIVGKQLDVSLTDPCGPVCHELGLEMTIDDSSTVRTVALGGAEDFRWRVLDETPVRVEFEDSGDDDYNDFQFNIDIDKNHFGIKARPIGCK